MDTSQNNYSNLLDIFKREYVLMGRTRVRVWMAWLAFGLIAGFVMGIALVANQGKFQLSTAQIGSVDFDAVIRGIRPRGFGMGTYSLLQPAPGANMYYVSPLGNDLNAGTETAPFKTINKAAQVAVAGDVVTIKDGTYQESVFVKNYGIATNRIVFQAENRGGVVLTGGQYSFQPTGWTEGGAGPQYITVRGLIFRNYAANVLTADGTALRAAKGWHIEDSFFDSPGGIGVNLRGDDIILTKSTLRYAYTHAIVGWGPANGATSPTDPNFVGISNLRVTDSIIYGNNTSAAEQPIGSSSAVVKVLGSKNALIENNESYGNYGSGFWFDASNFGYEVRYNYFHNNTGPAGRGLHLEISWYGLVEKNVFSDNEREGLAINNTSGVTARDNLFNGNLRSVVITNGDRGTSFPLKDVLIEYNQFRDWRQYAAIEPLFMNDQDPARLNVMADRNVYHPIRSNILSGWWGYFITTLEDNRTKIGWELNGSMGTIAWPPVAPISTSTPTPTPTPTPILTPTPTTLNCSAAGINAFTGCYYDNMDFTNLMVVRTDTVVDFNWGYGSPDPAIAVDTFSAKWEGNFNFEAASYTFTTTVDDGVRLYVDGALVIDKWINQASTTYTYTKAMTLGSHLVKMEFYDNGNSAVARLSWVKDTVSSTPTPTPTPVPVSDTILPIINSWDIQPRSSTKPSRTVSWNVSDSGGSYLARVEIQRALFNATNCNDTTKTGCAWSLVTSVNAPVNVNAWTSSTSVSHPKGTYWYGLHALDGAGNRRVESAPLKLIR